MSLFLGWSFYIATAVFLLAYIAIIGASANVVTIGIAEAAGHHIKFFGFMKYAFAYMFISVAISNVWLLLFH